MSAGRLRHALAAAGFTDLREIAVDYRDDLDLDQIIGQLYSAMPAGRLPAPADRGEGWVCQSTLHGPHRPDYRQTLQGKAAAVAAGIRRRATTFGYSPAKEPAATWSKTAWTSPEPDGACAPAGGRGTTTAPGLRAALAGTRVAATSYDLVA